VNDGKISGQILTGLITVYNRLNNYVIIVAHIEKVKVKNSHQTQSSTKNDQ
jgi:hypothetical protein